MSVRECSLAIFLFGFVVTTLAFTSPYAVRPTDRRISTQRKIAPADNVLSDLLDQQREEDENTRSQRHLRFAGVGRLYEQSVAPDDTIEMDPHLQILERLHGATVAVIGLGGVGSWAAEALCRSGVGNLILIDLDDICISNTNRQLHATSTTVGQMKIDEMRRRLIEINPQCSITNLHEFVSEDNVHEVLDGLLPDLDAVLDAIDTRQAKAALIAACVEKKIPIVTVGGSAGMMDPTKIVVNDLTLANGDGLLRNCKKHLRKFYGFPEGKKWSNRSKMQKWRIPTVYSTETVKTLPKGSDQAGALRQCDGAMGTACFVTGTVGFVAAGQVVDMIAKKKPITPRKPMR